jgi:RNA polymerase sigma-70 factor (ECF subfamily)
MNRDSKQVLTEWLVLTAQTGQEQAFRDLYHLWQADLQRFALSRIQRAEGADEVLTEVWLAIARGLQKIDDPACFPRWAFRIVERRCSDWIRQRERDRRREQLASAKAEDLAPSPPNPPAESDAVHVLHAAISRLPQDQQELLRLCYDHGRSVAEIAEILGIPAGTVKSRLFSIRATLRQKIERTKL